MAEHDGGSQLNERSTAELLDQLTQQVRTLVRQEVRLAKAETAGKVKPLAAGAGMFGAGGVFAWFGFGALTAGLILLLGTALAEWLAAMIVAGVYLLVAGVLGFGGKKSVDEARPLVPEQTVNSVKEDLEWTKRSAQTGRR